MGQQELEELWVSDMNKLPTELGLSGATYKPNLINTVSGLHRPLFLTFTKALPLTVCAAHNYTLQTLDLSWNNIRRIGGVILCKGLAANRCLTSVDLSWNGLGYDGSVALGALLKDNPTLKELNVSHNRIDWEGAKLVANGLRDNQTLRVLKIGNNPLTTTGCMDLLESISSSGCGLRMLGLDVS